jgi:hypothetical protein
MMEPEIYESVPHTARLLRYPDATDEQIAALIGADNVNSLPTMTQVRNSAGEWFTLGDGWCVGLLDDGSRTVCSATVLESLYQRA